MPGFTAHLKAQLQKRRIPLVSHVTFTAQEKDAPLGESPLIRPPGFWIGKHRRPFVCFTEKSLDHWNREVIEGQLKMLTACVSSKENTTNIFHILPLELLENLYKAQLNVGNYVRACVLPVGQFDMIDYFENDYTADTVVRLLEINYPLGVEVVRMPVDVRGDFAHRYDLTDTVEHIPQNIRALNLSPHANYLLEVRVLCSVGLSSPQAALSTPQPLPLYAQDGESTVPYYVAQRITRDAGSLVWVRLRPRAPSRPPALALPPPSPLPPSCPHSFLHPCRQLLQCLCGVSTCPARYMKGKNAAERTKHIVYSLQEQVSTLRSSLRDMDLFLMDLSALRLQDMADDLLADNHDGSSPNGSDTEPMSD